MLMIHIKCQALFSWKKKILNVICCCCDWHFKVYVAHTVTKWVQTNFFEQIYFCNMYTDFMFKKFAKMIQIIVILQQY